jgi:hypothetical protein
MTPEEYQRILKQMAPSLRYLQQNRAMLDSACASHRMLESSQLSSLRGLAGMTEPMLGISKQIADMQATWARSMSMPLSEALGVGRLIRQQVGIQASIASLTRDIGVGGGLVAAMMKQHEETMLSMTRGFAGLTLRSSAEWLSGLRTAGSVAGVACGSAAMVERAIAQRQELMTARLSVLAVRPTAVLSDVVQQMRGSEQKDEPGVGETAIEYAAVATGMVNTVAITAIDSIPPGMPLDTAGDDDLPPCNVLWLIAAEVQQVVQAQPGLLNAPNLYEHLRMPKIVSALTDIPAGLIRCNQLWPDKGKLFTYTDRFVESTLRFSQFWGAKRPDFCQIIRHLYFMIYEAAGKDSLRFLEDDLVTREEAEVVFDIKQFRNYHCEHDLEHGDQSDIQKKKRQLSELCHKYTGKPLPRSDADYATILVKLLDRTRVFLDTLCTRLERRYGSGDNLN